MSVRALLIYLCLAAPAFGQGFAGLGTEADGFSVPQPGTAFNFPADHGPHPGYRIEWWYLTANLQAADGADYGVQWTLFRSALAPVERSGWSSPQLWMGHAGLTTRTHQFVAERLARGGIGQAGVSAAPFAAWIDNWQMAGRALPEADALSALDLHAAGHAFSYELALDAKGPLVPQGVQGYSVKSEKGQASYYYSQPFYHVTGTLTLPAGVIAVSGQAWLDHEWSSQPLAEDQTGWDWFSLHFDSGEKMMGFRLRGRGAGFTSATWIGADGRPQPQTSGALRVTPLETAAVAGRSVPIRWRVQLPEKGVDVTTLALNPQAWMDTRFPYWEGPIRIEGSHAGHGYLEMTGYR
ncbi:lipocalin-like domain-containing protein [Mesorhizobium sp. M1378]|uniref:lipocalin-like domain-containing protein n=1 Tax=Mesorhizobium sp. M1378 TaxID=2957092 RepID=UPI003335F1E2